MLMIFETLWVVVVVVVVVNDDDDDHGDDTYEIILGRPFWVSAENVPAITKSFFTLGYVLDFLQDQVLSVQWFANNARL